MAINTMDHELEIYKLLVDDAPDYIAIIDLSSIKILYLNNSFKQIFDLKKEATTADYQLLNILETHDSEHDRNKVRKALQAFTKNHEQIKLELNFKFPKKSFFGEVLARSKFYNGKQLIFAIIRDLSEIKKLNDELTQKNNQLEAVSKHARVGLFQQSPAGEIYNDNDYAKTLFDSASDPNRGKENNWQKYIVPKDLKKIVKLRQYSLARQKGVKFDFQGIRPDKTTFWGSIETTPHYDKKGTFLGFVGSVVNLTKEKKREKELEIALRRFEIISREAKIGLWEFDIQTQEIYWSKEVYELFDRKELLPPSYEEFLSIIYDKHSKSLDEAVRLAIAEQKTYAIEYQLKHSNKWILSKGIPEVKDGKTIKIKGTALDITDFKKKEADLTLSIKQSEKLRTELEKITQAALIGEAATGIAHELNQPLASISSSADLLIRRIRTHFTEIPECMEKNLRRLEEDTICAGDLVHSIKNLYAKKKTDQTLINLENQMQDILLKSSSCISYTISKELKKKDFYFSPTYLAMIFNNLLDNSKEASNDNLKNLKIDFKWSLKDNFICLEYTDNGPGISPELKNKVFQHFFSTKKSGTGIGLSLIYTLLEFYHGSIKIIDSKEGVNFQILFPLEGQMLQK